MNRRLPLGLMRWFVLGAPVVLGLAAGCGSPLNKPLNSNKAPFESRVRNDTRAAIRAEFVPPEAMGHERQIRPATGPVESADADAGVADTPARPIVDSDGYFVGLAISGGGSRSANFAAACMFQLQRLGILQRVDYISSVSGGSLAAAYYCTQGEDWNPETVQKKLSHAFASDSIGQTLLPWNAFGLMFTSLDRTDILAATFGRVLFSRGGKPLTYADLRPDRPRLLINATDLQSGKRFIFSNEAFDEINSDLASFPIARAVAASSAVPVLLHQLTLKDHSTAFDQYHHLIDGGVADNLGARTLVETFAAHVEQARVRGEPDPYPNGAVMIFLDATVEYNAKLSAHEDISFLESLVAGAGLSTTSLLNRAGSATLAEMIVENARDAAPAQELRASIKELQSTGRLTITDRRGHPVRVVHISLAQVGTLRDVPFTSFRESVNNIATYFNIDPTEAYNLYQAADLLIGQKHEPSLLRLFRPDSSGLPATRPAVNND